MSDPRQQLIEYIKSEAVFFGDFTLSSGTQSTYYVDLRKITLDARVAPLIGQVMCDLIADIPGVHAVGGLTMGADPVAAAVLHQGVARGRRYDAFVVRKEPKDHGRGKQVEGPDVAAVGGLTMGADPIAAAVLHRGAAIGRRYDAFVVRKEPKGHGRGRQVEGPDVAGKRVVVLEDTSTTGGSPLKAIEGAGYEYRSAIGLDDLGLPR